MLLQIERDHHEHNTLVCKCKPIGLHGSSESLMKGDDNDNTT